MTFEECVKEFPLDKTIIGNYASDQTFYIKNPEDIEGIENWPDPPLEWAQDTTVYEGSYPFIVYEGNGEFVCWYYCGFTVSGYLNETENPNCFYPATYSEDFGWERFDPHDRDNYNMSYEIPDYKLRDELMGMGRLKNRIMGHKWMTEQVAYHFDVEKYLGGEIITTYEQLKEFVNSEKFSKN